MRDMAKELKKSKKSDESGRKEDPLPRLFGTMKAVASTLELDGVLESIVKGLTSVLKTDVCSLRLLDEKRENLVLEASYGHTDEYIKAKKSVRFGKTLAGLALQTKSPVYIENVQKDPRYMRPDLAKKENLLSFLSVPLLARDRELGVLNVYTKKARHFSKGEMMFLSAFADQAAIAIDNARTFEEAKLRGRELAALNNVASAISSILSVNEVLRIVAQKVAMIAGSHRCTIFLYDPKTGRLSPSMSQFASGMKDRRLWDLFKSKELQADDFLPCLKDLRRRRQPIFLDISSVSPGMREQWFEPFGIKHIGIISLISKEEIIGILMIDSVQEEYKITAEQLRVAEAIASQASSAIENARLFEELHTSYLPTLRITTAILDAKDAYTGGHSEKVMEYSVKVAHRLAISREEMKIIEYASLLHDIGKVDIPADILLRKPGKLSPDEWIILKSHSQMGADIVEQIDFLKDLAPIILHHHESYDGTGYPDRLMADEIPVGSRVINVVDSYLAMISDRPYHSAMSKENAMAVLRKSSGTQCDPEITKIFLSILKAEESI